MLAAVELTGFAAANVTTLALKDVSYSLQQFKGGIQHGPAAGSVAVLCARESSPSQASSLG